MKQPTIVLDVAHNEDGIKQIIQQIANIRNPKSKIHFVIEICKR